MPKISWNDIISRTTERNIRNSLIFSLITIFSKFYNISFKDFSIFWISIPEWLVDTSLLILIILFSYLLVINWIWDIMWYRLWYNQNSISSQIWTELKLDKDFIRWWLWLLEKIYTLDKESKLPNEYKNLDDETKRQYEDFKTNIELYIARLEYVWNNFKHLSIYVKFYVFWQSFLIPLAINIFAIMCILFYWRIILP